ncbi:MAG: indole-3-glycerol phosphate synthase TrpC [Phycisphaeraceae bacterium]|nr:indole-3-glycerol phosphate synthase TrpC [Phycisphaerales bacterium]MCB9844248.1 indole-3-glycerol phosphate synthase TrpC [Phycisphaeraceae bacterium]
MPDPITLDMIVEHKRREVEAAKRERTIDDFKSMIEELGRPRNFFGALVRHPSAVHMSVIAEIKRKSPSAGWIRPEYRDEGFDPVRIARRYHANGASAISCLTDREFFAGDLSYIHAIRDAVPLPVLRKDFIVDPWQVWESRAYGADAILLIAETLNESQLVDMMILAHELELTSLVEVHSMENLLRVRPHVGFPLRSYNLLGINNRDLSTMQTDLNHTLRLLDLVDDPTVLVSESGIRTREDISKLRKEGVRIVLVGESLMRHEDPGAALAMLLGKDAV